MHGREGEARGQEDAATIKRSFSVRHGRMTLPRGEGRSNERGCGSRQVLGPSSSFFFLVRSTSVDPSPAWHGPEERDSRQLRWAGATTLSRGTTIWLLVSL